MPMEPIAIRALNRYGHTLYRLALLRDGNPQLAQRATVAAFTSQHWDEAALDERLEARLIRALPAPGRRPRRYSLAALPHAFRRLPARDRLALGMRLLRGYDTAAIAEALGCSREETRAVLVSALAALAGDDPAVLPNECRMARTLRLDEAGAGRGHLLVCEACRDASQRWDRAEQGLTDALLRGTESVMLPRAALDDLASRLRGQVATAPPRWQHPGVLSLAATLVVIVLVTLLIVPRGGSLGTGTTSVAPRDLLRNTVAQYGLARPGTGIVHRRYIFNTGAGSLEAETWVDATQPGRHRMQLSEQSNVVEWQAGDGEQRLRYMTLNNSSCGQKYEHYMLELGAVHVWRLPSAAQQEMGAQRWQMGSWVLGRRYLEQALEAPTVRSLGSVEESGAAVTTVLAEGGALSGTLLIKVSTENGDLREIRRVLPDGGAMRSTTVWQLIDEELLSPEEAKKSGVFTAVPVETRPRTLDRTIPILDPGCPILSDAYVTSMAKTIGWGWPPLIGLAEPPTGVERIFVAGRGGWQGGWRSGGDDAQHLVVYVVGGKRLILAAQYDFPQGNSEAVAEGDWRLHLQSSQPGIFEGVAAPLNIDNRQRPLGFAFYAEGWERNELVEILGSARPLTLVDALAQQEYVFDPDPPPVAVLDLIRPTLELAAPHPGKVGHSVSRRELRARPEEEKLRDPYHYVDNGNTHESWLQWSMSGDTERYRSDARDREGKLQGSVWQDSSTMEVIDMRLNTLRRFRDQPLRNTRWSVIESLVTSVFRYGQYTLEPDLQNVSLEATRPITDTDYLWMLEEQKREGSSSTIRPWLADLDPVTLTFRTTFERDTKRLLAHKVLANGSHGTTMVEATIVDRYEVLDAAPDSVWEWDPPSDANLVEEELTGGLSSRGTFTVFSHSEAVAAAPTPLWGWSDEGPVRLKQAKIPRDIAPDRASPEALEGAVAAGVAVELSYDVPSTGRPGEITMLQGEPAAMRRLFQQMTPTWVESEARTVTIAGTPATIWVMRSGDSARIPYQHRLIWETDQTFIVVDYVGGADATEDALLRMIELLVPLS